MENSDSRDNFEVTKNKLPNGLEVLFYKMPWANSVTNQLWVTAGPRFEPSSTAGLAHFLEHVLFGGTKTYATNRALDEAVESFGGNMDAATHREYVVYQFKMPYQHQIKMVEFLGEIVLNPLFAKETINREQDIIKQEIKRRADDIESYSWDFVLQSLWNFEGKISTLGRSTLGSELSIKKITSSDLLDFKNSHYVSKNMFLVVAGNFDEAIMLDSITETFGQLAVGDTAVSEKPDFSRHQQRQTRVFIDNGAHASQSHVILSFLLDLPATQPATMVLKVLDVLLQKEIFDLFVYKTGLSYSASTYAWIFSDHVLENIKVEVAPEKVETAVLEMLAVLKNLNINSESVERAKNALKKYLLLDLADTDRFAEFIGEQQWYNGSIKSPAEVAEEIDDVKVEQIKALGERVFRYESALLTVVGKTTAQTSDLEKVLWENLKIQR